MLKQFKKSLNKTIVLDRKIADVLVRYLVLKLYHIIPSQEEGSIAPLSDGGTAIGTREYFFQWIEENVGLEQKEIIERCVGDFLGVESHPQHLPREDNINNAYTVNVPTNQNSGDGTKTSSVTDEEKKNDVE